MSLKRHELANNLSCLNKAASDEPVFVLRAKDPLAAQAVRLWAAMAESNHEPDKIIEALDLASQMEKWREDRVPKTVERVSLAEYAASPSYPPPHHTTPRR